MLVAQGPLSAGTASESLQHCWLCSGLGPGGHTWLPRHSSQVLTRTTLPRVRWHVQVSQHQVSLAASVITQMQISFRSKEQSHYMGICQLGMPLLKVLQTSTCHLEPYPGRSAPLPRALSHYRQEFAIHSRLIFSQLQNLKSSWEIRISFGHCF